MDTRTIAEEQWIPFFDQFSRDHTGWSATIEVLDAELGPQRVAADLPLQGISFDTRGTRPSSVEVVAGDAPDRHVSHVIDMPLHIRLAEHSFEERDSIELQIEPARGPVTLVHLRADRH